VRAGHPKEPDPPARGLGLEHHRKAARRRRARSRANARAGERPHGGAVHHYGRRSGARLCAALHGWKRKTERKRRRRKIEELGAAAHGQAAAPAVSSGEPPCGPPLGPPPPFREREKGGEK